MPDEARFNIGWTIFSRMVMTTSWKPEPGVSSSWVHIPGIAAVQVPIVVKQPSPQLHQASWAAVCTLGSMSMPGKDDNDILGPYL